MRDAIVQAEGVIISSPEYVRAIPGGLKNAIDWRVSGEAIIDKPVALIHGSHRDEYRNHITAIKNKPDQ